MSLNLHNIVSNAIASVNAFTPAVLRQSTGYTTGSDGTQLPVYTETQVSVQVQPITGGDLLKMDGLNLQRVNNACYISGAADGVVRVSQKGGDLLIFNRQTWLVVQVLEDWLSPGWTKVAVVLQDGS